MKRLKRLKRKDTAVCKIDRYDHAAGYKILHLGDLVDIVVNEGETWKDDSFLVQLTKGMPWQLMDFNEFYAIFELH